MPRPQKVGIVAAAVATVLTLPSPAYASVSPSKADIGIASWEQCGASSNFCLWEHAEGTGGNFFTGRDVANLEGFDNLATSYWNRTNWVWCVYERTDFGGGALRIAEQERGHFTGFWNDNVSSVSRRWSDTC